MPLKTKGLKPGSVGKQTFQVYIPGVGWRTISAFVRADGSFDIIPPKRPATPLPPTAPVVNSTVPNPRILNKVKPIARNLVMNAGRAGDPEPYCFGIQYARPIIVGADDDGERLVLDMLWSVGEIGGLSNGSSYEIWMPDIGTKSVPAGSLHEHFVGTAGQSASTIMTALKGSYDALPNKAHSVITMQAGWNLNVLGVIWGVKCFDPRPSPQVTQHTENPALILADVFTRCGYTVDWDSVADAADWADGLLTSPNLQRSKIGGQIRDRQSLSTYVTALAQYAGTYIDLRGGSVIFVADKPRSSTHTVTTEDIVAGSERLSLRGSRNAPELVGVTYLLGSNNPATAYFGASGGSGTESSLNMPFFDSQAVAGLKAKEVYNKGQNPIESLEFISWDDGLIRTVGDVGTITLPSVGLSSQLMALEENEPIQRGRWRRRYVEYDVDNYPLDTTGIYGGNGNQTLYNPYFPPEGPLPTLTYELAPESPEWTRIKIEFPNELWAYLQDFYVTVTTTTDLETILYEEYIDPLSSATSPQIHTTYTDFVAQLGQSPQVVYRVNVYVRSIVDALSEVPGTADITDPVTVYWNTSPLTSWQFAPYGGTTTAALEFDGSDTGFSNNSSVTFYQFNTKIINPLVAGSFSTGDYLVMYDNVTEIYGNDSATLLQINGTSNPGTWVNANGALIRVLDQTANSPQRSGQVYSCDVHFAQDNGSGSPVTSSIITKPVTFMSWAADDYMLFDTFTDTNGTALSSHTPTITITSPVAAWSELVGSWTIQSNNTVLSAASPTIGGLAVADMLQSDGLYTIYVIPGGDDVAIAGRVQDANNYWKAVVEDTGGSDPILKLIEVSGGTPTVRATKTMTGRGPTAGGSEMLQLMFYGNAIYAAFTFRTTFGYASADSWDAVHTVSYTSASFNTQTQFGIESSGSTAVFESAFFTDDSAQFIANLAELPI